MNFCKRIALFTLVLAAFAFTSANSLAGTVSTFTVGTSVGFPSGSTQQPLNLGGLGGVGPTPFLTSSNTNALNGGTSLTSTSSVSVTLNSLTSLSVTTPLTLTFNDGGPTRTAVFNIINPFDITGLPTANGTMYLVSQTTTGVNFGAVNQLYNVSLSLTNVSAGGSGFVVAAGNGTTSVGYNFSATILPGRFFGEPVPEPTSIAAFTLMGLAGAWYARRRVRSSVS